MYVLYACILQEKLLFTRHINYEMRREDAEKGRKPAKGYV